MVSLPITPIVIPSCIVNNCSPSIVTISWILLCDPTSYFCGSLLRLVSQPQPSFDPNGISNLFLLYCLSATHLLVFSLPFLLCLNCMINHFNLFFGSTLLLFASLIRPTALVEQILSLHLPLCNSVRLEASTQPHMTTYLKWVLNAAVDCTLFS